MKGTKDPRARRLCVLCGRCVQLLSSFVFFVAVERLRVFVVAFDRWFVDVVTPTIFPIHPRAEPIQFATWV
jgi:hypothetical protein